MLKTVKKIAIQNQFNPSWIGILTNPFFIARKGLSESILESGKSITGRTIDIGCGTKPYEKYFKSSEYIGLEYDTGIDSDKKTADYYYTGNKFPFDDNSFDSAVCNQVLEHIFTPELFFSEIYRILKKNGTLLLTVPFVWDEHEQPFDYARYSSFGLKHLVEKSGFQIIKLTKSIQDFKVIIQLLTGYLYKITRRVPVIKQITQLFLIFPITITGIILAFILPKNKDLYLDNVILAKKI